MRSFLAKAGIGKPVDISSLAAYRIAFGFCLGLLAFHYYPEAKIISDFGEPQSFFSFALFKVLQLPVLDASGMYTLFTAMGLAACCVMLGLFYRASLAVLFVTQLYLFLLEKSYAPDPRYLYLLVTLLMFFVSANREWSVDCLLRPATRRSLVPFWQVAVLRAQFACVYLYSGLSKLVHPDWREGRQLSIWLKHLADTPVIGPVFDQHVTALVFSWGGMIFDLSIGYLLLNRPTRKFGIALAVFFHLTNKLTLDLYLVPWFVLAGTLVFLEPHTPRTVVQAVLGKLTGRALPAPDLRARQTSIRPTPAAVIVFLTGYFITQVFLPLRPYFYPGSSSWTREGLRFSWHLMNDNFKSNMTVFYTPPTDPGCLNIQPFNTWQSWWMSGNPEMILQYAHLIRDELKRCDVARPEVYVDSRIALNGRDDYPLIDPAVDLAKASYPFLKSAPWIMPHPDIQARGGVPAVSHHPDLASGRVVTRHRFQINYDRRDQGFSQ